MQLLRKTSFLKYLRPIGSLPSRLITLQTRRALPIVVILIVAALLRLNHITQPFTDAFSWRQSSTAMIADNFYRKNWNIFYPEVNWTGPGPNYQGREFQTVSYITALAYVVVGQHDWVGRSVAVVFSLWGVFALHQLVRRVWDEERAIASAAVMAVLPGSVFIERSFIPDPVMVALVVTSFWMLTAYLQTERWHYLLLASAIGAWGLLTKIPGLIVGLPMAYTTLAILGPKRKLQPTKLATLAAVMILTMAPVIAYYLWASHLSVSYPPYHFAGGGNWLWNYGLKAWWNQTYFLPSLIQHFNNWMWTGPVIALVSLGLLLRPPTVERDQKFVYSRLSVSGSGKAPWLFHWWFLAGAVYYFIGAKELIGNPWNFHIINPAAAALTGHGIVLIASFTSRFTHSSASLVIKVILLLTIGILGQHNLSYCMYKPYANESYRLGLALRQATHPDELVVTMANAFGDPVAIYYSQRRGWVFPPAQPGLDWGRLPDDDNEAIRMFEKLRANGAGWLGIVDERKKDFWTGHPTLVEHIKRTCEFHSKTAQYVIYRILNPEEVAKLTLSQDQALVSVADAPLVTQEIRYRLPEAGKVFLVWGINGWAVMPEGTRPAGTVVKDAIMYTPMTREGDTFTATVQVPASATIDYVFQITKTRNGAPIEVWDANGDPKQDYHTSAVQGRVAEVQAPSLIVKQIAADDLDTELPWLGLVLLIGGCAVLGTVATRMWSVRPQVHQQEYGSELSNVSVNSQQGDLLTIFKTRACRRLFINSSLVILCALITITITFFYISNEHTFYYWDYAAYHDMTIAKTIYFRELPKDSLRNVLGALKAIWRSTAREYNDIHTLLIVPFILTLGDSRLVYVLSIALAYLSPFTLITGAIAAKLIPSYPRTVFWSATLLSLFVPAVWLPTLRGYPDTGSAALIALAILIYLQDLKLKHWWQIALISFCIALAILFRRHFIYEGIAFFVAITLQTLIAFGAQVRQHPQEALHDLLRSSVRISLTVASSLITLAILGWPFIDRVLNTNFGLLYASYEVPSGVNLQYYRSYYGWIACIFAVLGFAAGIRTRVLARPVAIFVVLFAGFSLMQWTFIVRQLGIHYTLHFTLGIVLGLIALGWTAWITLRGGTRTLILSASSAYLVFNAIIGLAPVDILSNTPISPTSFEIHELFSANYPPQKREDYEEIARLVDYLRTITSADEPIYVVASSDILSDDLLWHVERTLYGQVVSYSFSEFWQNQNLNILHWVPFADSRDYYPLEKLLQSQYIVVAIPFQHHMRPEEQDVIKVVFDAFMENWEFVQDFTRLPVQFSLADGVVVNVYKRIRTTSLETALRTLKDMQDYVGIRPGGQLSWINLSGVSGFYITRNRDNSYNIVTDSIYDQRASTISFLYLDGVLDQTVITGELICDDKCTVEPSLSVAAFDTKGKVISTTGLVHYNADTPDFSLPLQTRDFAYPLLNISVNPDENDPVDHCWLSIRNLAVSTR